MTITIEVELDKIRPNPYQPRESEDPAVVAEIAASIAKYGLQQIPKARAVDGVYQLAFGHTRRAAYELLAESDPEFAIMPLVVDDLDDRVMFELGILENVKRRDLNPIELARAMRAYMDTFHATSAQAADLFECNPATVRGKIRLLDLPAETQAQVASGEISERNARQILTVARVAPKKVDQVATALAAGADPEREIGLAFMSYENQVVKMWEAYMAGGPRAGAGLWPLDHTEFDQLPDLKINKTTLKDLDLATDLDPEARADLSDHILRLTYGPENTEAMIAEGVDADLVDKLNQLINPPACSACPLMAKVRGDYYCGFKACHARKKKSWLADQLEAAAQDLKIPIYDRDQDGKDTQALNRWDPDHEKHYEDRHADLRLVSSFSKYGHGLIQSKTVKVVATGDLAATIAEARNESRTSSGSGNDYQLDMEEFRKRQQIREDKLEKVRTWMVNHAVDLFVDQLPDSIPVLSSICEQLRNGFDYDEPAPSARKATKIEFYRRVVIARILWTKLYPEDPEDQDRPVEYSAKYIKGIAKEWGVELPADWIQTARAGEYQAEGES